MGKTKSYSLILLEILKEHTDENHRLSQEKIKELMELQYGISPSRNTISSNLELLSQMGYAIDTKRKAGTCLLSREFDESELRVLIDSVLFSKHLSAKQADELILKLKSFGNKYFDVKVSHVANIPDMDRTENKQVLISVSKINDAIDEGKKISFKYAKYGADKKLHESDGTYIVNPYQMLASRGRYFLLANLEPFEDYGYFRIDKIRGVEILDEAVKPMGQVEGLENGLNLPKHMAEHIYMFSGKSVPVKIKTSAKMMDTLVDWFGKDISVIQKNEEEIVVRVVCNENAIKYWALQYGSHVEILEPMCIREEILNELTRMMNMYTE